MEYLLYYQRALQHVETEDQPYKWFIPQDTEGQFDKNQRGMDWLVCVQLQITKSPPWDDFFNNKIYSFLP